MDSKPFTITGVNHTVVSNSAPPPSPKSEQDLGDFDIVKKILNVAKTGALRVSLMNSANITLVGSKWIHSESYEGRSTRSKEGLRL